MFKERFQLISCNNPWLTYFNGCGIEYKKQENHEELKIFIQSCLISSQFDQKLGLQRKNISFYRKFHCENHRPWRDEIPRSSISHGLVSKINPNLPIWGIKSELRGIMVNKGQIHREFRYFWDIFWNLVKLDDELRWEIRENSAFRKITQRSIRGIKNCSIWISNHGEIKDGSGMKFLESRRTLIEIKMKLNLNWNPKPKIDDTWG